MISFLHFILSMFAVAAASYVVPGIVLSGIWTIAVASLVLGALNIFVKPIIILFTLPINLMTLGLFTVVINAFMVMLAAYFVPGFYVDGFIAALIFSIVLAIFNMVLDFFV